jgi:DNA polymerase-3 subunit epsilon
MSDRPIRITDRQTLDDLARELEASGNYRVLRRLAPHSDIAHPADADIKVGIFFDVETTGLDIAQSEILELAMVPFEFSPEGTIYRVGQPLQQFNEPSQPIDPEITALTGITDAMVMGHKLDVEAIERFVEPAALIIAHNAAFDRPPAERVSRVFKAKPWACSMSGIQWREEGVESRRLIDLLSSFGYFFENHRAVDDCLAAIALLGMRLPRSGNLALDALLRAARLPTYKIIAEGAPFELKDAMKQRGYSWNSDLARGPRAWSIEVLADAFDSEIDYLQREVFQHPIDLPVRKLTAYERFSAGE